MRVLTATLSALLTIAAPAGERRAIDRVFTRDNDLYAVW